MESIITIPRNTLLAARLLCATTDPRHYLNGVLVEATPKTARLVAVHGNYGAVFECPRMEGELNQCPPDYQVIIPYGLVDAMPKGKGGAVEIHQAITDSVVLTAGAVSVGAQPLGDYYPPYRKLFLGLKPATKRLQYPVDQLVLFHKVAKLLGSSGFVQIGDQTRGIVTIPGNHHFAGIMMPVAATGTVPSVDWVEEPLQGSGVVQRQAKAA